ncbi:MAG: VCBS repeat-containing protein [Thermoanaerobaculia bacterium]
MKRIPLFFVLAAAACTSAPNKPAAPPASAPPAAPGAGAAGARMSRVNPNVVEETETYYIERLPKSEYVRVDDRRIRHPMLGKPIEFFKEDESYYYIQVPKTLPEERDAQRIARDKDTQNRAPGSSPVPSNAKSLVPLSDFEDLDPPRVGGRLRLEEVKAAGLPQSGMWRASFTVADVNGDEIPDIVAPPNRLGNGKLRVWIGDGRGAFSEWPLTFTEGGKPLEKFSVDYGGVAVGDIDGDGKKDIVVASHSAGLVSLFGDGKGGFDVVRQGLPRRDFSAQAIALVDVDEDGKLDIVASRDVVDPEPNQPVDKFQIRVYLFKGSAGWERKTEGLVGGFYSNSLLAWDYDGDGRKDVLTGSHYAGALTLLWKNQGDGTFAPAMFPTIEVYSYHFASAPGTLGKDRAPAFADSFLMQTNVPTNARAFGISLYAFRDGAWTRHRLWRKKDPTSTVYGLAMGDLDGDGMDDVVFADSERRRVRVLFQQADASFVEAAESDEPALDSPGQCVRLADLDKDGRLDLVVSKTVASTNPNEKGGWNVYLNRSK